MPFFFITGMKKAQMEDPSALFGIRHLKEMPYCIYRVYVLILTK